jgi:hypothetical protein
LGAAEPRVAPRQSRARRPAPNDPAPEPVAMKRENQQQQQIPHYFQNEGECPDSEAIEFCLDNMSRINEWQYNFLLGVSGYATLSEKQADTLNSIITQVHNSLKYGRYRR